MNTRGIGSSATRNSVAVLVAVTCVGLFFLFTRLPRVFGMDYAIQLPHNYQLVSIHTGCVVLGNPKPNEVSIGPSIDGYSIRENLLVGHTSVVKHEPESEAGYFIVDMRSGKITSGMSRSVWRKELQRHGIDREPRLVYPARWRALL